MTNRKLSLKDKYRLLTRDLDWEYSYRDYKEVFPYEEFEGIKITETKVATKPRLIIADYGDFLFYTAYFPNGGHDLARVPFKLEFSEAVLQHAEGQRRRGHLPDVDFGVVVGRIRIGRLGNAQRLVKAVIAARDQVLGRLLVGIVRVHQAKQG